LGTPDTNHRDTERPERPVRRRREATHAGLLRRPAVEPIGVYRRAPLSALCISASVSLWFDVVDVNRA